MGLELESKSISCEVVETVTGGEAALSTPHLSTHDGTPVVPLYMVWSCSSRSGLDRQVLL